MNEKKTSFEEALNRLKECSEKIKSREISLEDSIRCYEEGKKYFKICSETLREAQQKIETFEITE